MIRKAIKDDAEKIAILIISSWKTAYRGLIPNEYLESLKQEKIQKNWEKNILLQNEDNKIFVYEESNKIVGVIRFGMPLDKENRKYNAEIQVLYVEPACKRNGIGTKLFNFAKKYFISQDKKDLIIWCLKGNNQGLNFYKKMGGKTVLSRKSIVNNLEVEEIGVEFKI